MEHLNALADDVLDKEEALKAAEQAAKDSGQTVGPDSPEFLAHNLAMCYYADNEYSSKEHMAERRALRQRNGSA